MALRGNLKELSLPDIFQLVTFSGKTGVLRIQRSDGAEGSVWFRDGEVFFAQSNWRTELLGERLVRAQRITPMALDRALELRAAEPEGGKRLGDILVEQGYITEKVLEAFVQEQMQDTIFDLMRWDEGDFEFEAMPEAPEEDIGLAVSIENVIMEGSRRLDEWNRIKKKIPSTEIVFKMATAPGEGTFEISLKPIEWNLLLLVDSTRSVADLATETNRTDFEVARILYGLFSAGLLEFASDEEVESARAQRVSREAKFAEAATKRAAGEAQSAAASKAEAEAKAVAEAQAEAGAPAKKKTPAKEEAAAELAPAKAKKGAKAVAGPETLESVPAEPVEEPEFLGAPTAAATSEDLDMLEAAMGALLDTAVAHAVGPVAEPVSYTPAEEPAFIGASQGTPLDESASVLSVEELLGDLEGLRVEAPVEPVAEEAEPAIEPGFEFFPEEPAEAVAPAEPQIAAIVEAPTAAPVELQPVVPAQPYAAAAAGPQVEPELQSLVESLEEPEAAQSEAAWEPGTFVVVPGVAEGEEPQAAAPEAAPQAAAPEGSVPPWEAALFPARAGEAEVTPAPEPVADIAPRAEPVVAEAAAEPEPAGPAPVSSRPVPGLSGFEHDLMALGLGELPPELQAAQPAVFPQAEPLLGEALELEPVVEPMGVGGSPATPLAAELGGAEGATVETGPQAVGEAGDVADFSALLESLDISADDEHAVVPPAVDIGMEPALDSLLEAPAAPGGVISTDAYLGDLAMDQSFEFSGELTDELSALTGADRPVRPAASVRHLPAEGETMLHRDSRVDRDTLLKIIDGIKNL